jgi:stage II sporulation protein M
LGLLDDAVLEIASNRSLRLVWYLLIVVFGVSAVLVAVFYNSLQSSVLGSYMANETQQIKEVAGYFSNSSSLYALLPVIIYANNSLKDVIMYALLIVLVFPPLVLIINGGLVGYVSMLTLPIHGNSLVVFYYLVPHGVIEIPAFSLTAASIVLIRRGVGAMYYRAFPLLVLSLTLLIVAAIVESTVTPGAAYLVRLLTNQSAGAP